MNKKDIPIIPKGWGEERVIHNDSEYCGKILIFKKGYRCSYHSHNNKRETFYLQSGKLLIKHSYRNDIDTADELILNPGEKFEVPRTLNHQMIALEDSELFEFSTHHEDSDSYRIVKGD